MTDGFEDIIIQDWNNKQTNRLQDTTHKHQTVGILNFKQGPCRMQESFPLHFDFDTF